MKERECKQCGNIFTPKSPRQYYCNKEIIKKCPVCNDEYISYCHPDAPTTCSKKECKKRAGYIASTGAMRKCKSCGREFKPTSSTQEYCNLLTTKTCAVCGKEFTIKCTGEALKTQTCSEECANKLASMHRQESYMQQTKICELCGKEFHPRSNTQKVCEREHFSKCIVCGKEFKLNYKSAIGQVDLRKTCSDECYRKQFLGNNPFENKESLEKYRATSKERYGVSHPMQNKDIQKKQANSTKQKYGVEHIMQSDEGKAKIIATNREKYGTDWALQNKDMQHKMEMNNVEKFGVTNPMLDPNIVEHMWDDYKERTGYDSPSYNPEVIAKTEQTNLERYGSKNVFGASQIRNKIKQTNLEKYGTPYPMQNAEIKAKAEQTNLEKYGATNYLASEEGRKFAAEKFKEKYGKYWYSQTAEWKETAIKECTNIDEWLKFTEDPEGYIDTHYISKPKYRQLSQDLGVRISTVGDFIARHKLTHKIAYCFSYMEEEIREFLDSLSIKYNAHDRNVISPYEIDIYLPEYKFGIECNPTATHNSSVPYMDNENISVLSPSYHKMKTDMCESKGVNLLHVFGYDWTHKKEIMLSMIRNKLSKTENIIYARNCSIVEVPGGKAIQFLNENHRQGSVNSPIRLGLVYNNQLVSLMTFGNMRNTIGKGNEDLLDCYELVRFCSLLNTSVVGGASKLLKHFIKEYNPKKIRSFSDRAHTTGSLYPTLGFNNIRQSDPGYVWVDKNNDKAYNRVNAQKQNIQLFLKDDSIDLNRTEREIMIEHGFVQVYDSGTITWEWQAD